MVKDQQEQPSKEARRKERISAEEVARLAKEKIRKDAYFAKEKEIEAVQKHKKAERTEKRAKEEIAQLAKERLRKEAYLVREEDIAEAQKKRSSRTKTR